MSAFMFTPILMVLKKCPLNLLEILAEPCLSVFILLSQSMQQRRGAGSSILYNYTKNLFQVFRYIFYLSSAFGVGVSEQVMEFCKSHRSTGGKVKKFV